MVMIPLILLISILLIITFLLISKLFLLDFLNDICIKIRDFIRDNESFFSISFLILFSLEQVLLLYLIYKLEVNDFLFQFIIGVFVVIVLSTASLEKIISDVKNKELKKIIYQKEIENNIILLENDKIIEQYKSLKSNINEWLKNKNKQL